MRPRARLSRLPSASEYVKPQSSPDMGLKPGNAPIRLTRVPIAEALVEMAQGKAPRHPQRRSGGKSGNDDTETRFSRPLILLFLPLRRSLLVIDASGDCHQAMTR